MRTCLNRNECDEELLIDTIMNKFWWMKIWKTSNSITVGALADQVETLSYSYAYVTWLSKTKTHHAWQWAPNVLETSFRWVNKYMQVDRSQMVVRWSLVSWNVTVSGYPLPAFLLNGLFSYCCLSVPHRKRFLKTDWLESICLREPEENGEIQYRFK